MIRRLFCPLLAAAALGAALLGAADRAEGAIRIRISDGTNTQYFYQDSNSGAVITSLGAFDIIFQSTATNAGTEGVDGFGELTQLISLDDQSPPNGTLPDFTFLAEVVDNTDVFGTGQITESQFNSLSLTRFTSPPFNSEITVTSQVEGNEFGTSTPVGSVRNETTVNGNLVSSGDVGLDDGMATGSETMTNASDGYTLSSAVVLSGVSAGAADGISLSSVSRVTSSALTPEPGSMAVWALGAFGLAMAAGVRKWRKIAE
jgi:hypothetical protein